VPAVRTAEDDSGDDRCDGDDREGRGASALSSPTPTHRLEDRQAHGGRAYAPDQVDKPHRLDDPEFVRDQYATEANLAARKSVYAAIEGPDPLELVFQAVAEVRPRRVLEVGGGEGELAERIVRELGAELVGIDQSQRMVDIQRGKGIDARAGDVQELPIGDGTFDLAIAAWMLYHVRDVERALSELARVLEPGGRLVAVTNSTAHLRELTDLGGITGLMVEAEFRSESGAGLLRRHFDRVERRDAYGWVTFDETAIRAYAGSAERLAPLLELPPLAGPLRVRREPTIFVAEKAS
jgi:SAM-dependent methyltransferase